LAEQTYARLAESEQEPARRILVRLADTPDHGGALVRRRVPLDELADDAGRALTVLADSRLVTVDEGAVEVAHEALLREWPRLRAWLDDDAEGRRLLQHLAHAARDWDAGGRDPGELYRGTRLGAAADWAAAHEGELNARERDFLAAGRAAAEQEAERQARANRRLRGLVLGVAGVLAVAIVAGLVALHQRSEARSAAVVADAQRLGAQALVDDRLDHAALLARAGVALDDDFATRSSLLSVLLRAPAAVGAVDYGGKLFAAAFSPDQKLMAVGDEAGHVIIYDARTRLLLGTPYRIDGGLVQSLDFSSDSHTLAAGSFDPAAPFNNSVVDLIDPRTRRRRVRVVLDRMHESAPFIGALTAYVPRTDDLLVNQVNGNFDVPSVLYRIDGKTGAIEARRPIGEHGGQRISVTADGSRAFLSSGGDDRTWAIDPRTLRIVRTYPVGAWDGVVSPDGTLYALGGEDGRVRLLDLRSGRVHVLAGGRHRGGVDRMMFTPDGRTLVTAGDDGRVMAWDVAHRAFSQSFAAHTGAVSGLAVSPDGRTAVSTGVDGRVVLWDLVGDRRLDRPFPAVTPFEVNDTPRGIAASPDGRTLAYSGSDGTVSLVDVDTLGRQGTVHALRGFAAGVAFSPDGRLLAVCGKGPRISLWDAHTLARVAELAAFRKDSYCQGIAFSPDSRRLAASGGHDTPSYGGETRIWDVAGRTLTRYRSSEGAPSLAFSPGGDLLAVATVVGDAEVRDSRTGRLVAKLPTQGADSRSVAFSPDGKTVVVGQYDGLAVSYSTANWRPVAAPLRAHTARITYLDFTADGRTLATASADGTAALWDVASQKPVGSPLRFAPESFMAAAFARGGRYLFAIPTHGAGVRFDMSPAAWERQACLIAGHDLTRAEWADAVPGRPYRTVCG
jgi:WD40 repeat protein